MSSVKTKMVLPGAAVIPLILGMLLMLAMPAAAWVVKSHTSDLGTLSFTRPELRVGVTLGDADAYKAQLQNYKALSQFIADYGPAWHFQMDARTGRVNLLDGGAIPFIPGAANSLRAEDFGVSCDNASCVPVATLEALARNFLKSHADAFLVDPGEFELDPQGSGPSGNSLYFLRFQWMPSGVPVQGASIFFRINNGNLIQVAMENIGSFSLNTTPAFEAKTAWAILNAYLGGAASDKDLVADAGTLFIVPITPAGMDADVFVTGNFSKMIDYKLVYHISFIRPGLTGTWEALVDAQTGDILQFVDGNRYGHVHGGIRPSDGLPAEEDHSFPGVDIGGGVYADNAGNFTGTSATTALAGKYAHISDSCGSISAATTTGDINFGSGPSDINSTDCTTPTGNTYGAGNTKPSRTLYWNVSNINVRAQVWNPTNTWLPSNYVTLHVNGTASCNASSGGADIYFYKRVSGSCNNLGEIPSVAMHEWGHSYDTNDGSGGQDPPIEAYADVTGIMSTHLSCLGAGFLTSGNCSGYGDACNGGCTGVRDADWRHHTHNTPWTSSNNGSVYSCSSGSYNGPCGWEDHCESGIASQSMWDLAYYDLEASPTSLDTNSAWMLMDRLWFTGVKTMTTFYSCSSGVTSGCGGTAFYSVLRAIDDDGDGTANGTPHAAAIYAAMARHNIACGAVGDATNQNQVSASCPTQTITTLTASPSNNQVALSWPAVTNATRYWIYRNEGSCSAGFTRIAVVSAPTTTYLDTEVANGTTYNYRLMSATASDSCTSGVGACTSTVPVPCTTPGVPTIGTASVPGNNQITVTWTAGSPAGSTYNVYRSTGACPGGTYVKVGSGLTTSPWTDNTVSGGTTYSYEVTAVDSTGGCESTKSGCASALATGACTAPPTYAGLTSVTNSAQSTCTLTLTWAAGTANCGGPVSYNVYRSTTSGFTPAPANKVASGVSGTSYVDAVGIANATTYYYVVRAVDSANSSEDTNLVQKSGAPTGPITTSSWTDTFEGSLSGGGFDQAGWTHNYINGTTNWAWSTAQHHDGTHSWFAADIASVSDMVLVTPSFGVGASTTLSFWHMYTFESSYDGGTIEYTTDGGTTWVVVPAADYVSGAPTVTISSSYSNPIGGKLGWSGTLATLTQVTINLYSDSNLLNKVIQLRFHEGNDSSVSSTGWYVDTVVLTSAQINGVCTTGTSCTPPGAPSIISVTDVSSCAASGIQVAYTAGSGATSHDLYKDGVLAVSGYTSGAAYVPGDTSSHTYVVRAISGSTSCYTDSTGMAGTDANAAAGTPVITGITDVSACAASGIQVAYTAGSGATSHNLLRDGTVVVTGYASGATYTPGNTSSHTYIVQAVKGACTTNSTGTAGTDANSTPGAPVITGITDVSTCAASGIKVAYTAGSGASSHNLLKDGTVVVTGYTSNATYTPGDTNAHTYVVRAISGTCSTDSTGVAGTDANGMPGAPVITGITDVSACAQSGIQVAYTAGSGATSHNLVRNSTVVVTGYASGATYNPGNTTTYTYYVQASNTCGTTNSAGVAATDTNNLPGAPVFISITDVSACAASGIQIAFTAGTKATSHDLYKDNLLAVTGYTSGATYIPGDTATHTYRLRAINGTCATYSGTTMTGTDANNGPGAPVITGITDVSACAASGIQVAYTAGSGAASHNLLKDGAVVVTGYTSGAAYTPGDTSSHTYVVRAVNGACTTDSTGVAGTDANSAPGAPTITGITDISSTLMNGIQVNYTPGSGASSHNLYKDGSLAVTGYASGAAYLPGDTSTHTYVVRAISGSCYANSNSMNGTDAASGTPPPETAPGNSSSTAQSWAGDKSTQSWPPVSGATSYTLYRGIASQLPNLLSSNTDSCTVYTGSSTSFNDPSSPAAVSGHLYWYLVTASNGSGQGSAGNATGGARQVNSTGTCP